MCKEVWDMVAELSQLWEKGLMRTIALGSTDGFDCFSCTFSLSFQPVIVPVGRIALGRILNVVGSSIDPMFGLGLIVENPNESYLAYSCRTIHRLQELKLLPIL